MKKKLTQMTGDELNRYAKKYEKEQWHYKPGSRRWRKCQRRVMRAVKLMLSEVQ